MEMSGGYEICMSNGTHNNISYIPWLSVLLLEETGVPGKKTTKLPRILFFYFSDVVVSSSPRYARTLID